MSFKIHFLFLYLHFPFFDNEQTLLNRLSPVVQ